MAKFINPEYVLFESETFDCFVAHDLIVLFFTNINRIKVGCILCVVFKIV